MNKDKAIISNWGDASQDERDQTNKKRREISRKTVATELNGGPVTAGPKNTNKRKRSWSQKHLIDRIIENALMSVQIEVRWGVCNRYYNMFKTKNDGKVIVSKEFQQKFPAVKSYFASNKNIVWAD